MLNKETVAHGNIFIAARFEGKWILRRNRVYDTCTMPYVQQQDGETALDAVWCELRRITGTDDFVISPVVMRELPEGTLLYFAEIAHLGELAQGMMLCERPPEVQPDAMYFSRVQAWLNLQCKADEIWDVYDINRTLTGRTHRRGDLMKKGDYHLVVDIWILRADGKILITKRSPNKGYPNMWEVTGGSAVAGDDSLTAALREVEEETGLKIHPENGRLVHQYTRNEAHKDIWLFKEEFDIDAVVLQEGETCDKRAATPEEVEKLYRDGRFVPVPYFEKMMTLMKEEL